MSEPKLKFVFDFEKLKQTFGELCPDFKEEPDYERATVSRRFAQEVIFTYSKEAAAAKSKKKDVSWSMRLDVENESGTTIRSEVKIQTHWVREPPQNQPFVMRGLLLLSFKQASLLAVEKYCQLVPHQVKRGELVLTPLAGAVFSKFEMPQLAKALGEPLDEVVVAVISSCQTDGYYLEHSRCHIALVALIKTVSDLKMRASIVKKTIKMYKLHGKDFDMDKFKVWSTFLRKSAPAKRRCDSDGDDYDKLVEQVLAFNINSKEESRKQKVSMKCAANFQVQKSGTEKI
ncbi:uncharacterized protein LOC128260053 [Drosophila gunungcola]|uniref:Uncharacterized protein n=1 Tax=Drosophila gunungcola TaxID=103775 RepID=A0A9P9YPY4_9MUSC|nr:uncharacterized protein LOC128258722 [Drosophila gunungcola]XP_052848711.1 uncharacterized protein LOC128260053 [Drosophila gunungcola]KAI8036796.1 hypothetical protein M5D96_010597 [Drosophila gunungcola]KAI8040628.1 hypothetical protein M5D96_006571 [Drosophila gunungcola]